MSDPIILCFKNEFDRFFALMQMQINRCPESLWNAQAGGYTFWQQIFHAVACVSLYEFSDIPLPCPAMYDRNVMMLNNTAPVPMSKEELLQFSEAMKIRAHAIMQQLTVADLPVQHKKLSAMLGKEMTNQNALIGLIRHMCYHLGCCDCALREHGVEGVY